MFDYTTGRRLPGIPGPAGPIPPEVRNFLETQLAAVRDLYASRRQPAPRRPRQPQQPRPQRRPARAAPAVGGAVATVAACPRPSGSRETANGPPPQVSPSSACDGAPAEQAGDEDPPPHRRVERHHVFGRSHAITVPLSPDIHQAITRAERTWPAELRDPGYHPLRLIARLLATAAVLLPVSSSWLQHAACWLLGLERVLDSRLPGWETSLPDFMLTVEVCDHAPCEPLD